MVRVKILKLFPDTREYVFKSIDNPEITIEDLNIQAEDAISCVYFLGPESRDIKLLIVNCPELNTVQELLIAGNVRIKYCTISNNQQGLYLISERADLFYNIIANNNTGISYMDNELESNFYNNIFYKNVTAIKSTALNLKLANNIFYMKNEGGVAIESGTDQFISDHNIFWPVFDNFVSINNNTYNSLDDIQEYTIFEKNSIQKDPEFINASDFNFQLKPSSPAIDRGIPVGLAYDIMGLAIPFGIAPDIGAVEANYTLSSAESIVTGHVNQLTIFPNPAQDLLTLKISSKSSNNCKIYIFDLSGRVYFEQSSFTDSAFPQELNIDISTLENGMYFVSIIEGTNIFSQKFTKL